MFLQDRSDLDGQMFLKFLSVKLLQGRFDILSLSGAFTSNNTGGTKGVSGGMSVSLAGPDGRVLGGGLAGMLVAASPIQVGQFHIFLGVFGNWSNQFMVSNQAIESLVDPYFTNG